jgi:hypothetical protein
MNIDPLLSISIHTIFHFSHDFLLFHNNALRLGLGLKAGMQIMANIEVNEDIDFGIL